MIRRALAAIALLLPAACGGSSSWYAPPGPSVAAGERASGGIAYARFLEGAPELETSVGGIVENLGTGTLSVNAKTIASFFTYGTLTQFVPVGPGNVVVKVFDSLGYSMGPFTAKVAAGESYSIVLVGTYPHYKLLVFAEPGAKGAALSVYEASPAAPQVTYGRYRARPKACGGTGTGYRALGAVHLGDVVTASLGPKVAGFGGYVGKGTTPMAGGSITPCGVDAFDARNALPFNNVARLSLFVLDPGPGTIGPVIGNLDR
ncbi:MAG TPA: DUF4397 domain-containing protein [Candidatus Acidoferrales bacterium]|nr:DUF4397 domain-containing protein [Candidatus Acidoferrales bacterium]